MTAGPTLPGYHPCPSEQVEQQLERFGAEHAELRAEVHARLLHGWLGF